MIYISYRLLSCPNCNKKTIVNKAFIIGELGIRFKCGNCDYMEYIKN